MEMCIGCGRDTRHISGICSSCRCREGKGKGRSALPPDKSDIDMRTTEERGDDLSPDETKELRRKEGY